MHITLTGKVAWTDNRERLQIEYTAGRDAECRTYHAELKCGGDFLRWVKQHERVVLRLEFETDPAAPHYYAPPTTLPRSGEK